jgi:hypothetical protein
MECDRGMKTACSSRVLPGRDKIALNYAKNFKPQNLTGILVVVNRLPVSIKYQLKPHFQLNSGLLIVAVLFLPQRSGLYGENWWKSPRIR